MYKQTKSNKHPAYRAIALSLALSPALLPTGALGEPAPTQTGTDLIQLLEQQGWQAQTAADGSLIFSPPAQITRPAVESAKHTDLPSGQTSATPQDIERLLRERGWRTETDASGNTLLRPARAGTKSGQPAEDVESTTVGNTAEAVPATDDPFTQFQRSLSEKGWRVSADSDGSVIVYPPVKTDAPRASRAYEVPEQRGYCAGIGLAAVGNGEIALPIDIANKAERLATDWIANFGHAEYAVGRIRRINQVYAVSIVDKRPPHHLRNQLIIRSDNGRIIAVY